MTVKIPALPYARIAARSIPCKEIGGDFFDVVADDNSLSLVARRRLRQRRLGRHPRLDPAGHGLLAIARRPALCRSYR